MCSMISNSSLPSRAKWIAYHSIIEPAVCYPLICYPLINSYCSSKGITKLDSIMSSFQCSSLTLNRHFPQAILHGPTSLSVIGLPSPSYKTTKERINYFLYKIQRESFIQKSADASLIYTQLEIGSFHQFFSLSYMRYGHLVTKSMGVPIWSETEPHGLIIRPDPSFT